MPEEESGVFAAELPYDAPASPTNLPALHRAPLHFLSETVEGATDGRPILVPRRTCGLSGVKLL